MFGNKFQEKKRKKRMSHWTVKIIPNIQYNTHDFVEK